MSKITITYEKWTIPDYRNGETEKDSKLKKLEIESDIGSTTRFSWCMEDDDIVSALEIILGIVQGALEKGKELLRKENEIEKIDHLNAPVKYKEIYINNAKKEE